MRCLLNGRRYIVRGQIVQPVVLEGARAMRHDMTPEESLLWEQLRGNKLGVRFRRQQVISGLVADFYCHAAGLIVEVDGSQHSPEVDGERDAFLRAHHLRLLRFSNRAVQEDLDAVAQEDLDKVVAEIRAALDTWR